MGDRYEIAVKIWGFALPFLSVVGMIGNMTIFIVFSRQSLKKGTLSLSMRILAVSETVFFISMFALPPIRWTILDVPGDWLYTHSDGWCKFLIVVIQPKIYLHMSICMLTILSVDRMLALMRPHHRHEILSKGNISRLACLFYFWQHFVRLPYIEARIVEIPNTDLVQASGQEMKNNGTSHVCHLPNYTLPIKHGFGYTVFDIIMSESILGITMALTSFLTWCQLGYRIADRSLQANSQYIKALYLVIANVVGFILLHAPEHYLFIARELTHKYVPEDIYLYSKLLLLSHHSGSFFLYCLPNSGFRAELRSMILHNQKDNTDSYQVSGRLNVICTARSSLRVDDWQPSLESSEQPAQSTQSTQSQESDITL